MCRPVKLFKNSLLVRYLVANRSTTGVTSVSVTKCLPFKSRKVSEAGSSSYDTNLSKVGRSRKINSPTSLTTSIRLLATGEKRKGMRVWGSVTADNFPDLGFEIVQ